MTTCDHPGRGHLCKDKGNCEHYLRFVNREYSSNEFQSDLLHCAWEKHPMRQKKKDDVFSLDELSQVYDRIDSKKQVYTSPAQRVRLMAMRRIGLAMLAFDLQLPEAHFGNSRKLG